MKVPLIKIIENLVAGDKGKAISYAELMIENAEKKYRETKDIFDKYEIMTARNVMHTLKGEPKEGGQVICDSMTEGGNKKMETDEVGIKRSDIAYRMRIDAVAAEAWHEMHGEMASADTTLMAYAKEVEDREKYLLDKLNERERKIRILEERLRIAHEAFDKIDEITKEEETAIVAGNANNRLTCDDHAFKYLFYEDNADS